MTSVQGTWIFDTDLFCCCGIVDVVAIPSTLLNRTVTCPTTTTSYLVGIPVLNITSHHLSVNRHLRHALLSFRAVTIPYKPLSYRSFKVSEEGTV